MPRQVDRNRKTDTLIAAAVTRQDGGVDADELAARVNQSAARIAGINRGVSLDEIFKTLDLSTQAAAGSTDNAHGHGAVQAERVADREHHVAYLRLR